MVFGELDDRFPNLQETRPVVVNRFGPIATNEGIHLVHAKQFGCVNDIPNVLGVFRAFFMVGAERIGIVPKPTNANAELVRECVDLVGLRLRKVFDFNMRDTSVTPFGFALRPAHDFDTVVAVRLCRLKDFAKRQVREDGANESELHRLSPCGGRVIVRY